MLKNYNRGTERAPLIDYRAFINGLRIELTGQRLQIVEQAFRNITGQEDAQCFTIKEARGVFSYEEFEKWCDAIEVPNKDDELISWESFRDFYADISMTIFQDKKFLSFVTDSWKLDSSSYSVTDKDVEQLVAAIRLNLLKYGNARYTEEYVLRDLYREFNTDNNGSLSLEELNCVLSKINLKTSEKYVNALFNKLETHSNGTIEFEEFVSYLLVERYHKY